MGQRFDTSRASSNGTTASASATQTSTNGVTSNAQANINNSSSSSSSSSSNSKSNTNNQSGNRSNSANNHHHHHHHHRHNHQNRRRTTGNNNNENLLAQRNDSLLRFLQSRTTSNGAASSNAASFLASINQHDLFESDLSSDDGDDHRNEYSYALPLFLGLRDVKCLVCKKQIPADDVEAHIIMCLTKPKITYNEDVLTEEKGECIICLELLEKGELIARLPCLCIYHKNCIDSWLKINQSCPAHPPD